MLVVLATIEVHPDDTEAAVAFAAGMVRSTHVESGCMHYAFGLDILQPNRLLLSERWRDAGALVAHFEAPHMTSFRQRMRALRLQQRSAVRYDCANPVDLLGQ
jgi:quinol monooxygenase YgiN